MFHARKSLRPAFLAPLLLAGASCVPPERRVEIAAAPAPIARTAEVRQTGTVALPPAEVAALPAVDPSENISTLNAFDAGGQAPRDRFRALECLTAALYHEARSEGDRGQRAVAQVVLNRVRHPAFPASVCGVVYQGSNRRTGCQFSFTCDGSLARRVEPAAWSTARRIAVEQLDGATYAPVGHATHYHTTAIRPYWAPSLVRTGIVGAHVFYRWPGLQGTAAGFRQHYAGAEPGGNAPASRPSVTVRTASAQPDQWRGDGVTVRIHRGAAPAAAPRAAMAEPTTDFGVRIHRGAAPAIS